MEYLAVFILGDRTVRVLRARTKVCFRHFQRELLSRDERLDFRIYRAVESKPFEEDTAIQQEILTTDPCYEVDSGKAAPVI